MWISSRFLDYFRISEQSFADLKEQNAALRAERDALKSENSLLRVSGDWLRSKVNQLELERAALLHTAHGISVPVPQLEKVNAPPAGFARGAEALDFSGFDDMGDKVAQELGIPLHDLRNTSSEVQ